ncbi:MAG: hypothetical protein ABEH64_07105 [Salinirussus sp.]
MHLERIGRTNRQRVPLPTDLDVDSGTVVSLSLEGTPAYALVDEALHAGRVFTRASDNRRLARTGQGADRLREWISDTGLAVGDPINIDVVTPGYAYGLRRPGERIVYSAPYAPDDSLSRIAEDLD